MRAVVFAVLALAACATTRADAPLEAQIRADNVRLDNELRAEGVVAASIGETADLGSGLTVKPLEVLEDSRCPAAVECIWAGRLRIRANVSGEEVEMTFGRLVQTPRGAVMFAVVRPSPWSSWPTAGERPPYRFGFRRALSPA